MDPFIREGLLAVITVNDVHNHSLNTAEALRFLPPAECKEKFIEYFKDGMGIAESSKYHEGILQLDDKITEIDMANSSTNPPYRAVQYWYNEWRLLNLGPRTGNGVIEKLKEKLNEYEERGITICFSESPFAVAIVTPIMKRAHHLKSSAKIVFVDSTSSCDPDNHSITFMLCPCSAGAVPLAVIITKGQTQEVYQEGFELVRFALKKTFNGKGYPTIFMTDDSEAEIKALSHAWPLSKNFLCIFHVLQSIWRWLWNAKNEIPKDHRSILMLFFQNILYANSPEQAEEAYKNACGLVGSYLPTHEKWCKYLENYWKRKELWCLAFRNEEVRGHNTNNYSEVCIRIFKDQVLSRVKAYNVLTLIDFVSNHLESFYKKKFRDFANNRCASGRLFLLSLRSKASSISKEAIQMLDKETYIVKGNNDNYVVNTKTGCCSCPVGLYGRCCKHQYSVFEHFDIVSINFPPIRPRDKHEISILALGDKAPPLQFYEPLISENPIENEVTEEVVPNLLQLSSNITVSESNEEATKYEEEKRKVLQEILKEFTEKDKKFNSSLNGMNKFLSRLRNVKSPGNWEHFLHTAGGNIPLRYRSGSAIRVQPTSLSRRSANLTRGSKRLPVGRPACAATGKKRKHCLSLNVKLNQPNVKRH